MTQDDILEMARSAGLTDGIELQHEIDAVMRFAELVAAAEREALANEFSEAATKTLEYLAATTIMPSRPMVINNPDTVSVVALAIATEREACAKTCEDYADSTSDYDVHHRLAAYKCANLIRKRGEK